MADGRRNESGAVVSSQWSVVSESDARSFHSASATCAGLLNT
jgi:hypothetical protein